jgi:hypothetical protein
MSCRPGTHLVSGKCVKNTPPKWAKFMVAHRENPRLADMYASRVEENASTIYAIDRYGNEGWYGKDEWVLRKLPKHK